jgi:hypothetical protein
MCTKAVLERVYKLRAPTDVLVVEYGDVQFSFLAGCSWKRYTFLKSGKKNSKPALSYVMSARK